MTDKMPLVMREVGRRLNSGKQEGAPRDVAELIVFLGTPGASGISGNTVRVCGQSLIGASLSYPVALFCHLENPDNRSWLGVEPDAPDIRFTTKGPAVRWRADRPAAFQWQSRCLRTNLS
jgi:hypothetical protein